MNIGSLLSNWGKWTDNPDQNSAIQNGLLSAGLALMQSKGSFGEALGQAGQVGLNAYQGQMAKTIPNKLAQLQLKNAESESARKRTLEALPQQFYRTPEQTALAGGGGPTIANAANIGAPSFDMAGYAQELSKYDPLQAAQIQSGLNAKKSPLKLGAGDRLVDPETLKEIVPAADQEKLDPFMRLMKYAGVDPGSNEGRKLLMEKLRKDSSHTPPTSIVNYGSPVPIDLGGGRVGYAQPPNKAGAPTQMLTDPTTGKPLTKPADSKEKDLTEAQAKATTFLGQMRSASKELDDIGGDRASMTTQFNVLAAGTAANALTTKQAQRINQAQEQWAEAFLRFKTGAASTEQEVRRNVATFFPRVGDSPDVIEQKKRARAQAEKDMEIAAGRGTGQLNARDSAPSDVKRYNPVTGKIE